MTRLRDAINQRRENPPDKVQHAFGEREMRHLFMIYNRRSAHCKRQFRWRSSRRTALSGRKRGRLSSSRAANKNGGVLSGPADDTARDGLFTATRWTLIRRAAETQASTRGSHAALSELCSIYWRPVYLFLRRQGVSQHDAQDFTQGFFAQLLASRSFANASEEKGRFRTFLLGALKHFRADAYDHAHAAKRGGGLSLLHLDEAAIAQAEAQALRSGQRQPDRVYEREWAAALLRQVMERLEQECRLAGKGALFHELRSHLAVGEGENLPYDELAARLGRPATTLRSDVARLRTRYRAILREEVRGTLSDAADVDEELRYLRQVITT
jgi:RNA polymerase sigma-70 factor (ECF subfamily)